MWQYSLIVNGNEGRVDSLGLAEGCARSGIGAIIHLRRGDVLQR